MIAKASKVVEWLCEDILAKYFRYLEKKLGMKRDTVIVNIMIQHALRIVERTINGYLGLLT